LLPPSSTLVVPCYNEEARFRADAFASFLQTHPDVRLLFVNDGSRDGTLQTLRTFCDQNPGATVLDVQPNGGKGEAVRRGMLHAMDLYPEQQSVGFWDADLATPLDAYPRFCAVLESHPVIDMVFGSRIRLLGRHVSRNPMRHYAGRAFATTVSLTLGLAIYDSQCGAKLFRANDLLRRLLNKPFVSRWIFDVEIIARFLQVWSAERIPAEDKIYELPLKVWVDVPGSKVGLSDFFRSFGDLVKIRLEYPGTRR
jgi:glycosyltransferase involved in cell wall biosynthesis